MPEAGSKLAIKYLLHCLHCLLSSPSDEEHYQAGTEIRLAELLQTSHIKPMYMCVVFVCV